MVIRTGAALHVLRATAVAAAALSWSSARADEAPSAVCVVDALREPVAGVQPAFRYNDVVLADHSRISRAYDGARRSRDGGIIAATNRMKRRLERLMEENPGLDDQRLAIITPPPLYTDFYHSCDRDGLRPSDYEFSLVYEHSSPRVVGDMCTSVPRVLFHIGESYAGDAALGIEVQDFYHPDFMSDSPLGYEEIRARAEEGTMPLMNIIQGLTGIRMMQCGALSDAIEITLVQGDQIMNEPIMEGRLLLEDEGLRLVVDEDRGGRTIAERQRQDDENFRNRYYADPQEQQNAAAAGAAILLIPLIFMASQDCLPTAGDYWDKKRDGRC